MSWEFITMKTIRKTRKPHKCVYCGRLIPVGSREIHYCSGKFEGDFQSSYACHWCADHASQLVDEDDYICDFGQALREDVFPEQFEKYEYCDCVWEGELDAEFEGDYLVWRCCDCGKVGHREYMPISAEACEVEEC